MGSEKSSNRVLVHVVLFWVVFSVCSCRTAFILVIYIDLVADLGCSPGLIDPNAHTARPFYLPPQYHLAIFVV